MRPKFIAAIITLTLGLAHAVPGPAAAETTAKSAARRPAPIPRPVAASVEDTLGRNIFQILLGEFALLRGDLKLGNEAWSDLAIRTRDPQVLARATEVASFAHQYDMALELSKLWLEIEPDSAKARQAESALLVMTNRLDDLAPQLSRLLEQEPANVGNNLLQLNRMLARHNDKQAVLKLVERVAAPYDKLPEAHFALSQAAANAGEYNRAQLEIEKALEQRPNWETAALIRAQLQLRSSPATAIDGLLAFVNRNPQADDARLTLARLLISERRYTEARSHFDRLIKDNPDNPDVVYPVAMLTLQQGDIAGARPLLEKLLNSDFHDKSAIHFFLGQIDEEQEHAAAAIEHYRLVVPGQQYVAANSRAALILLQQGNLEAARALLHEAAKKGDGNDLPRFMLAETQLLREAGHEAEAFALVEKSLAQYPDNLDLLYEAAMLADRLDQPAILEARLQHLLAIKPDHPQALNALGYSWADRNIRLAEAERLIAKAVELAPKDPFIMDSQGWVLFRLGKINEAQVILERAYGLRADPEIAAHLGEVLWRLGRRAEAGELLREAARKNPENAVLNAIIKKLLP